MDLRQIEPMGLKIRDWDIVMPKSGKVLIELKSGSCQGSVWLHYPNYKHIFNIHEFNDTKKYDIGFFPVNSRLVFALIALDKINCPSDNPQYNESDSIKKLPFDDNKWEIRYECISPKKEQQCRDMALEIKVVDALESVTDEISERPNGLKTSDKQNACINSIASRVEIPRRKLPLDTYALLSSSISGNMAIVYTDGSEVVAVDSKGTQICSGIAGIDDARVISSLINSYPNIILQGAFSHTTSDYIRIKYKSNISIRGIGASLSNISFVLVNSNNILIQDISFSGYTDIGAICSYNCNDVTVNRFKVQDAAGPGFAAFYVQIPDGTTNTNQYYNDCIVLDGNKHGFAIWGDDPMTAIANNFHFNRCEAHRCGLDGRIDDWTVGFNLSEAITANHIIVTDCKATYCWESGFHMEGRGVYNDVTFARCLAECNGQKTNPMFGNGFLVGGVRIVDCISRNNHGVQFGTGCGIRVLSSAGNTICSGNITSGNSNAGIYIDTGKGRCIVADNISTDDLNGILLYGPESDDGQPGTVVSGNSINRPKNHGIYAIHTSEPTITDNIIVGGNCGIKLLWGTNKGLIANNQILECSGSGLHMTSTTNHYILDNRIDVVGAPLELFGNSHIIKGNSGYITEASGSSIGTGLEESIAHGLTAIPKGCKAWAKYLIGSRYTTEIIPFDDKNVYPNMKNGLAFEWRIE